MAVKGSSAQTPADVLDPDVRRFVDEIGRGFARHPDFDRLPPPDARRIAEEVREPWRQGGPVMRRTENVTVPIGGMSLRLRIHDPGPPEVKPGFIYLHGGGWMLFSVDTHDRVMREYAARGRVVTIGLDYPLAPEAKFPVALEQVVALVRSLGERGAAWGIDPTRVAVGGDSAGANLALGACLMLRDAGEQHRVRGMLLSYGAFDAQSSDEAARRFGGPGFPLSREEMQGFWRNYMRSPHDANEPLVCPLRARLDGLPPAFLTIPACDLLTEQSLAMAERLRKAGVAVRSVVYPGASHSFLEAVSISALADRALGDGARWLHETLTRA